MKKYKMSLSAKSAWTGRLFMLPFYLGFIFIFMNPLIQSLNFVFNFVKVGIINYDLRFIGLENIKYIFLVDANFTKNLIGSITQLLWQVPVILIASLFLSMILNTKFHGRTFVRAIFFLPVIVASGIIISIMKGDVVASSVLTGNSVSGGTVFHSVALQDLLVQTGLNAKIVDLFTTISNNMFDMLWKTGIQMIVFLAGLQNISPTLYEASAVEGATAWENFWKITMPMLSPIILINLIYTIVDSFTDSNNLVMKQVMNNTNLMRLGWASAMAWVYFLLIGIIILIVFGIFAKMNEEKTKERR